MKKVGISLLALTLLAACQFMPGQQSGKRAGATLEARSGSAVSGRVDFVERGGKVMVTAKVRGLKPNSEHGFHVHEKGDCSAADGMSTGGHFNPDGNPHGHSTHAKRHAGDMPNLVANANGEATASFALDTIRLDEGKHGIINRAVIVHAQPDDYTTQPTGNAGGRIACGLIRAS